MKYKDKDGNVKVSWTLGYMARTSGIDMCKHCPEPVGSEHCCGKEQDPRCIVDGTSCNDCGDCDIPF